MQADTTLMHAAAKIHNRLLYALPAAYPAGKESLFQIGQELPVIIDQQA